MHSQLITISPFAAPAALPLKPVAEIATGCVLVVAPHPDDETLGCGGAIALLQRLGCDVRVLVVSDGTQSHPRSRKYSAPALRTLREQETIIALRTLGVAAKAVTFLRLLDGSIPTATSSQFTTAVAACRACLTRIVPQTVFLPWRNDPHSDHQATAQLVRTALQELFHQPRLIEYPIWDWDPEQQEDLPDPKHFTGWRLDIQPVLTLKQQAIAAYRSQTTNLIDDDPQGFRLTPEMLANFTQPWEVYFEEIR